MKLSHFAIAVLVAPIGLAEDLYVIAFVELSLDGGLDLVDGAASADIEIGPHDAADGAVAALLDVCLGFCYDPVAALGFTILPQRKRLLATSSFVQAGF